jgi:hypothetical protein
MSSFAEQLKSHMQRAKASATSLARETGLTPQGIVNWSKGSIPRNRDKVVHAAHFLRLNEQETNELLKAAHFAPEYPVPEDLMRVIFVEFITHLLDKASRQPILLLTQANWGEPPYRKALLEQAKKKYLPENVLHLQPPHSVNANDKDYFSDLAEQCGFEAVENDIGFEHALKKRLQNPTELFLLGSRFEQGVPALRQQLASILRSLTERYQHLHIILCGGESLESLKYEYGNLSLLTNALVEQWPEMSPNEVYLFAQYRFNKLRLNDALVEAFLNISGGHPQLLNECFKIRQKYPNFSLLKYTELLSGVDSIWQLFIPFTQKNEADKQSICEWLQQEDLGKALPYLLDKLLRQLYWKNLLVKQEIEGEKRLRWRCEAIRLAGQEILCKGKKGKQKP